ncbi:DUF4317 domain-containing protein [Planococcus sp. CP5-4]|uniref:DUF4317 domain-containing protein n=1 Tax=unclassified Planococcus (in: firmicutes) TaxID=2662419 RepID=UPI001C2378FA|nr:MULTISPECIES: DUF4317 domain-containing protein [unclassified Planococcus (in: firmicutes)]MBU9674227.1 DUF4317 domain-containing protein [Planococcus sp. CP5-4_YE]MBV0909301.1 DUF4317 domain-containing protein [Planococcus sp. CP5-4_UN]MBW6063793.1 DUF4317 domain-containing protein [Planococcus sp. CP5-4]
MNKKDIAEIRKQFKLETDLLKIAEIYNVYIKQDTSEIFHEESRSFSLLDREQQELFLANFKKVLAGKLDIKLFEVKFQRPEEGQVDHTQTLLYEGLHADDAEGWKDNMQRVALKMVEETPYEKDMVITFIRGTYFKTTKREPDETEAAMRDEVYTTPFVLSSMNQTELPKSSLVFDFIEKEFKSNIMADPVIKLSSPVGGFLFPSFTNNAADVNRILYSAAKANKPDFQFIENVLNGDEITTAEDDKVVFEEIVKQVIGDEVNSRTLAGVYDEINSMLEVEAEDEDEPAPMLDSKEVERVLKASGIKDISTEKVEQAFQQVTDDRQYEMKASHIVPKYGAKSIKINTKVAEIKIGPEDLRYVKQVNYNGRRCILIEVEEDTVVEGFKLLAEEELE